MTSETANDKFFDYKILQSISQNSEKLHESANIVCII